MSNQTDDATGGIGALVFFGLIAWGLSAWRGGEQQGVVRTDDCREVIKLDSSTWQKFYRKFSCAPSDDGTAFVRCARAAMSRTWFFGDERCETAYYYFKTPDIKDASTDSGPKADSKTKIRAAESESDERADLLLCNIEGKSYFVGRNLGGICNYMSPSGEDDPQKIAKFRIDCMKQGLEKPLKSEASTHCRNIGGIPRWIMVTGLEFDTPQ